MQQLDSCKQLLELADLIWAWPTSAPTCFHLFLFLLNLIYSKQCFIGHSSSSVKFQTQTNHKLTFSSKLSKKFRQLSISCQTLPSKTAKLPSSEQSSAELALLSMIHQTGHLPVQPSGIVSKYWPIKLKLSTHLDLWPHIKVPKSKKISDSLTVVYSW